jgi:hypothetical protein
MNYYSLFDTLYLLLTFLYLFLVFYTSNFFTSP